MNSKYHLIVLNGPESLKVLTITETPLSRISMIRKISKNRLALLGFSGELIIYIFFLHKYAPPISHGLYEKVLHLSII